MLGFLRNAALRAVMTTGRRERMQGLEVVDISSDSGNALHFQKMKSALDLIAKSSVEDLELLRQGLRRIVVFTGSGTQFLPGLGACFIDAGYLSRQPTVRIAMSMVHEAEHARLLREGVRYEGQRADVERLCVEAEVRFALKIPGTDDLVAEARNHLTDPWWTDSKMAERRGKQLRASGIPEWLVRAYVRFSRSKKAGESE